ncbi:MAG: hypothetical protein HIU87_11395 [Acidobacteria bacterium]|nr:hypothetical protein [Acidobacteriota bacterium]
MGKRTKCLATAISVTVFDAAVATYYGGVVWKAFSVVIWIKLLLLLLAAMWAITLLHIWVPVYSYLRQAIEEDPSALSMPANSPSVEFAEEIDV